MIPLYLTNIKLYNKVICPKVNVIARLEFEIFLEFIIVRIVLWSLIIIIIIIIIMIFEIQTDHLILARRPDVDNKKKKTFRIVDFAIPADHRENFKESEKKD